MPDPNDKVTDPGAEMAFSDDAGHSAENKKTCIDCGTWKTPLWRGGPAGPKSLCNACGIRSRKKRRVIVGITKGPEEMKKPKKGSGIGPGLKLKTNISKNKGKFGDSWKRRLLGLSREVSLQPSSSSSSSEADHRRRLGEVEQAAVLLMALSYGYVYA